MEDSTRIEGRPPSGSGLDLPNGGLAVKRVLDSDAVDLVVGDKAELGTGAGQLADALRKVDDSDSLGRTDVENVARDCRRVHEALQRADRIRDVAERACLRPVTMDFERHPSECCADEARDHHSILAALPRSDGVEEADDDDVEPPLEVIRERQMLVHRLRVRVQPTLFGSRTVDPAVVFRERPLLAVVAVDLGAGGDEDALAEAARLVEDVLGPLNVRHHRAYRLLDDQPDSDGRCEVVDDVAFVDELVDGRRGEYGVHYKVVVAPVFEALNVGRVTRGEIVEGENLPAGG